MPGVDEDGRSTLEPIVKGVEGESPAPEDVSTDSSPVEPEPQAPETAPAAEAAPKGEDTPFHLHPRWQEKQREVEELRRQNQQILETLQRVAPQPAQAPQQDPWAPYVNHPDAGTAKWYSDQRELIRAEAQRIAAEQTRALQEQVNAGRQELARIRITQFRQENPDIKTGSQEEQAIAAYVQQGFDLEHAKKLALFDKYEGELRTLKSKSTAKQQSIPAKRVANVESGAGVPETSGLPAKKRDWRDEVARTYDETGGDMLAAANKIFGGKR